MGQLKLKLTSLRSQLILIMLVLGSAAIALSTYVLTREQINYTHEHIERELRTLMIMSQGSLNRTLRYDVMPALEEVMAEIKAHRRVKSAAIFNTEGEEVFNSQLGNSTVTLQQHFPNSRYETFERCLIKLQLNIEFNKKSSSYHAYIPIVSLPRALDNVHHDILVVEYMVPITWRDALLLQLPFLLLWVGALLSILALLLAYLNVRVARPARGVVSNIAAAEKRRLDLLQPISGAAELVQIDRAFTAMVAERERNEAQLVKLSTAVEQSNEGVIITDYDGNIEYVNQALVNNTGYSREQLMGNNPRMLSSGSTSPATFAAMWQRLTSGLPWTGELYNRRRDGTEFIELQTITPLKNEQGEITHYVGVRQDISEQKSIQERLHFLAYFDILTHLPNRVSVLELLQDELEQNLRQGTVGAFLLLNIDRLKVINDGRGFEFGNQVIIALSKRLQILKGEQLSIGHLGADTFCLTLPTRYRDSMQARTIAEDAADMLVQECAEPFYIEGEEVSLTISVGVRLIDELDSAEGLIRSAETAVHNAKEKGGNQWFYYRDVDGKHAEYAFKVEGELREAIKSRQLRCFLQTQVNEYGKLAGAESLVRWQHPERGMVSPADFIPIAERSDLIVEIDRWMLVEALRILSEWQREQRELTISVNISPRHLRRNDFVDEVLNLVEASGVDPHELVLEVTEGLLVDDVAASVEKMKILKRHGIQFSIDDFGTGYSSLAYIRQLPVNELKIDQSFIRGIPNAKADVTMVNSIISVAQNLGLRVLAEGIETIGQAEFCIERQIWGQGYFYDRPLDEASWRLKWLQ
ncbi:MAG TPA: EAL domain-containing protein [Aliidiomarina sp.]|nr:EAL domain-containing protein [Aliidiomarina sp.]